ncbi:MAG: cupin domain-containing protein [Anaerolineales bacterium]|nr:cupin domain-containing protein [Anaerolineales bacterium]
MSSKHVFSMAGKRPSFEEDGVADIEVVVTKAQSDGRYTIMRSRWLSTFEVIPHYHKDHSETFFVLEGQVEWTVGGETHLMNPGDAVYIPPNTVHSVKVAGGKDMHMLMVYEPGGYEDQADYKMNFTAEELEDPEVKDRIRKKSDFHVAE